MPRPPHPRRRPRLALVRGLAPRFALIITDRRLDPAEHISCTDDTVDVHYPETHIRCRLRRLMSDRLLCSLRVTHIAPDGSVQTPHHMDLILVGAPGTPAQRETLVQHFHAYHCAAAASRIRAATRVPRQERSPRPYRDHTIPAAA
ncbi:hypothetical protein ABZ384_33940 [Streptomyces cyaneofuscatus]|uniref:hypothetical protein n=1 Tax=Streptomyces cyaneofuscatus TaxID=66883 RepID=UPI0033D6A94B